MKRAVLCADDDGILPDAEAAVDEGRVSVAEGHDDDHGLDLALRKQVVEDEVGLAYGGPADRAVGPAVEEVEDRVGRFGLGVVAGRSVDVVVALVARKADDGRGGVVMVVQDTVGNVGVFPWLGCVAGDGEQVREIDQVGRDGDVGEIEARLVVDLKVIAVDLGRKRLGGERPDAVGVLRHGHGLGDAFESKQDGSGAVVLVAEGDGVVGVNLGGRREGRNLCDEQGRSRKGEQKGKGLGGFERTRQAMNHHARQFSPDVCRGSKNLRAAGNAWRLEQPRRREGTHSA